MSLGKPRPKKRSLADARTSEYFAKKKLGPFPDTTPAPIAIFGPPVIPSRPRRPSPPGCDCGQMLACTVDCRSRTPGRSA